MDNIIKKKQKIAKDTYLLEISCPDIAKNSAPGNFVILRLYENGEKIPLSIVDFNKNNITLVFKVAGHTTRQLANLRSGSQILDLRGPLGNSSILEGNGTICFVAEGVGIASIYPIMKEMYKRCNTIISILGADSKNDLFWVDKIQKLSHRTMVATHDGTSGKKGSVNDILKIMMRRRLDYVYAHGPVEMMKDVSNITWRMVRTRVCLNPIMIDGIGICGSCRVKFEEGIKLACVDGPEFDAHKIDWNELILRNNRYCDEEKIALKKCSCGR